MENNIQKKLNEIQHKLIAPKGQTNEFGGYKYRNCEDILEVVKPLLGEAVLKLNDEIVQIGDRYYVKASVVLTMGEGSVMCSAYAREALNKKGMDESQITGAASSYARKYALQGLFAIDNNRDADSLNNNKEYNTPDKPAQKPNDTPPPSKSPPTPNSKAHFVIEVVQQSLKDQFPKSTIDRNGIIYGLWVSYKAKKADYPEDDSKLEQMISYLIKNHKDRIVFKDDSDGKNIPK